MQMWHRFVMVGLALALLGAACAAPSPSARTPASEPDAASQAQPPRPKRVTMIMARTLVGLSLMVTGYSGVPEVQELVNAGLVHADGDDVLHPQLAEQVPTLENGLWKLLPDGRMELTWRLKPDIAWHDGAPFTADDLVFSTRVMLDPEVAMTRTTAYGLIEGVEAPDPRTIVARWKQPYIDATVLFGMVGLSSMVVPMPKHLLEGPYGEAKATFHENSYWTQSFVGTGPFRLRSWSETGLTLEANERYVLGRPKIDEIEVRWVTDPNTFVANLLAGGVDLSTGPSLSTEQALFVRDQWKDGRVDFLYRFWLRLNPQFVDPNPVAIRDVRLRRALVHAMDRQQMVDTLQSGITPVADVWLNPGHPVFRQIEPRVAKYAYDPRRAQQLIEEMGYQRGTDGMYRDSAGQRLGVEIRALESLEVQVKAMLAVADFWQRAGVATETVTIPRQREQDRAYRTTFPGFELTRFNNDVGRLVDYHSAQIPAPPTYAGQNRSRYASAELDALVDRFFATIAPEPRVAALGDAVNFITDQLAVMGLFHDPEVNGISNRMVDVAAAKGDHAPLAWNAERWDVK
jgi:peptide/nickel transport system substrate-binding protein